MQRICVVGTGYVGLVTGTCLADFGNPVVCVDTDAEKIEQLSRGQIPFYEFSLQELVDRNLREKRLSFSTDVAQAIRGAKVVFIAVGTPSNARGEADLSQVFQVARTIAENLGSYKLVVQKSTVPVGTGAKIKAIIEKHRPDKIDFDVASNPEFLREGSAVEDFMRPDRVVIGTWNRRAETLLSEIYRPLFLNETPMVKTSVETAELIKYAANAFLATKISYINEMSLLCEKVGADIKVVARGIGLDRRIGPKFLHAGPGYGGSCFPKDTRALASFSRAAGFRFSIVEATIAANKRQRQELIGRAVAMLGETEGKEAAVLGLSFKPQTDDLRESFSLELIPALQRSGAKVRAFDPVAMDAAARLLKNVTFCADAYRAAAGADLLVLATEWNEFRMLDLRKLRRLMRTPNLVDCRNIYDPERMDELGFRYAGIGRGIHLLRQGARKEKKP
ncbi:MAG: UDP-glucose/GDP-mannose dehydrogenase family protein [Candidatus Eisenbacteria bacterium]|nr:UDP-glucose/GDP-mannose dehydrogenase family protein [Candidatus Eisenbacteria bacterium]